MKGPLNMKNLQADRNLISWLVFLFFFTIILSDILASEIQYWKKGIMEYHHVVKKLTLSIPGQIPSINVTKDFCY